MDRELWKIDNYREFLKARRDLLAQAANNFLDSLIEGNVPEREVSASIIDRDVQSIPGGIDNEEEAQLIHNFNQWIISHGLPAGEFMYELHAEDNGDVIAIIDILLSVYFA